MTHLKNKYRQVEDYHRTLDDLKDLPINYVNGIPKDKKPLAHIAASQNIINYLIPQNANNNHFPFDYSSLQS